MYSTIATGIPVEHIELAWPVLFPFVRPAAERAHDADFDRLLPMLRNLEAQAWLVYDGQQPIAGIVTRLLVRTSGEKRLRLWLIGGTRLAAWAPDFMRKAISYAKSEGCSVIDGAGRPGWARIVQRFGGAPIDNEGDLLAWELVL